MQARQVWEPLPGLPLLELPCAGEEEAKIAATAVAGGAGAATDNVADGQEESSQTEESWVLEPGLRTRSSGSVVVVVGLEDTSLPQQPSSIARGQAEEVQLVQTEEQQEAGEGWEEWEEWEEWEPLFTFHGFQYVEVTGEGHRGRSLQEASGEWPGQRFSCPCLRRLAGEHCMQFSTGKHKGHGSNCFIRWALFVPLLSPY